MKNSNNDYAMMKLLHEQASKELSSGRKTMSNKAYRNLNSSVYNYDSKTKSYILRKDINACPDVPRRIKWT